MHYVHMHMESALQEYQGRFKRLAQKLIMKLQRTKYHPTPMNGKTCFHNETIGYGQHKGHNNSQWSRHIFWALTQKFIVIVTASITSTVCGTWRCQFLSCLFMTVRSNLIKLCIYDGQMFILSCVSWTTKIPHKDVAAHVSGSIHSPAWMHPE